VFLSLLLPLGLRTVKKLFANFPDISLSHPRPVEQLYSPMPKFYINLAGRSQTNSPVNLTQRRRDRMRKMDGGLVGANKAIPLAE